MRRQRNQARPALEGLDARIVCAGMAPAAAPSPVQVSAPLPELKPGTFPSADRFRPFTPADLQAYARAYLSFRGEANYDQAFDFNGTGFIGQNDATPILRGLASITPMVPLALKLRLAPGQQLLTAHPSVSGAATRLGTVTVVGQTTPNSVLFFDSFADSRLGASGNFKFRGGALVSDANGRFTYTLPLTPLSKNSLTTLNLLVRTPFNQQTIRAFPILRVGGPRHA